MNMTKIYGTVNTGNVQGKENNCMTCQACCMASLCCTQKSLFTRIENRYWLNDSV